MYSFYLRFIFIGAERKKIHTLFTNTHDKTRQQILKPLLGYFFETSLLENDIYEHKKTRHNCLRRVDMKVIIILP